MPITNTLKNAEDFRWAGFPDVQANLLAEKLEETAQARSEDLKAFIQNLVQRENAQLRADMAQLRADMAQLRTELREEVAQSRADMGQQRGDFHNALRDQLVKFVTIMAAMLTAAVAIIKLLPGPL
jgi:regulator of replication initiation timing